MTYLIFLIFFVVGLFCPLLIKHEIIKFPNPNNCNNLLYIDNNNICYRYRAIKIDCPTNKAVINY